MTGIGRFTVENSDVPKLGELNADQQKTCKKPLTIMPEIDIKYAEAVFAQLNQKCSPVCDFRIRISTARC